MTANRARIMPRYVDIFKRLIGYVLWVHMRAVPKLLSPQDHGEWLTIHLIFYGLVDNYRGDQITFHNVQANRKAEWKATLEKYVDVARWQRDLVSF